MKVVLIIISITISFRPLAIHTDHVEFSDMKSCMIAKQAIDNQNWGDGVGKPVTVCAYK